MVKNMYSHFTSTTTAYGTRNVRRPATLARLSLNINKIEKTVSIDHTTHKKNTCSYKFNSQRDPSMYVHIVVGTGRYTTSTTNMYNKDRFHVRVLRQLPMQQIKRCSHARELFHPTQTPTQGSAQ